MSGDISYQPRWCIHIQGVEDRDAAMHWTAPTASVSGAQAEKNASKDEREEMVNGYTFHVEGQSRM